MVTSNPIVCYIDGERGVFDQDDIHESRDSLVVKVDGAEYVLFRGTSEAGEAAREYWKDMADNDPREFTCLVGAETLIQWGMGHYAGPGSTQVRSLEEWLDLWLDTPEEHWASYDSEERDFVCRHPDYAEWTVAYRTN